MSQQQTDDGIKWIEAQVYAIAEELRIQLDGPPEWAETDPLNSRWPLKWLAEGKS